MKYKRSLNRSWKLFRCQGGGACCRKRGKEKLHTLILDNLGDGIALSESGI